MSDPASVDANGDEQPADGQRPQWDGRFTSPSAEKMFPIVVAMLAIGATLLLAGSAGAVWLALTRETLVPRISWGVAAAGLLALARPLLLMLWQARSQRREIVDLWTRDGHGVPWK